MEMTSFKKNSFLKNEQRAQGPAGPKKEKKSITYPTRVSEKKEKCRNKDIFEDIMAETFPNEAKDINLLI